MQVTKFENSTFLVCYYSHNTFYYLYVYTYRGDVDPGPTLFPLFSLHDGIIVKNVREKISLELTSSLNNLDNSLRIGSTNWIWPPENPTTRGTISDSSVTGPKSWHVGKVPKKFFKKIVKLARSFLCPQQFDKGVFSKPSGKCIVVPNFWFFLS